MTIVRPSVLLACLLLLSGCGGGDSTEKANLSGNWQATLVNTMTGASKSESGFLLQSGEALNGNVLLTGQTNCAGVGSAQGQVSGSNVTITVNQVGETVGLTGVIASDGSKMSGNYSILASPCGNSQIGTWTANLVNEITGNYDATFASTATPGFVFHTTGKISQGTNVGGSTATLTGSMQSSDAPCFTSATVSGQVSGTAVVLNILSSEGVALGQFVGTMNTQATTITGTYNLAPQSPSQSSCRDFGSASFTAQST